MKQKRVTIDGEEYEITQLGAKEGRRLWRKIVVLLAAPLKELSKAEKLDEQALGGALAVLLESIDEQTSEDMYETFGRRCTVRQGDKWPTLDGAVFDIHFAGRYLSMSKWLLECVLFNFADFLGDTSLGKMVARVREAASKRASQMVSTGSSGAS